MEAYIMSTGKLINELKLIESELKNKELKQEMRFIIDCLHLKYEVEE